MSLLKDLLDIPETIQRGDFVLRLAEGVTRPEETLRDYVVTPELRARFDEALAFIRSALQTNTSKASYLHGSFGSGKSHFMAVLHLILQGNAAARSIPELAQVVAKHNDWTAGSRFLLVPYHMIGAQDVESGILGGYVEFIRRTHPEAPVPGVYRAEGLFRDAENLRQEMGDAAFFSRLNQSAGSEGGWGELAAGWDTARFDIAREAPPESEDRAQLIGALIRRFFGSYDIQAGGRGEAFLPIDQALSVVSRHAASLGYHAVLLFLDELVLWLASHVADLGFIYREGQKLAKLVEAQTPDRPVPIVSFVARQRDLRDLVGDFPGAERLNFSDALGHWEGRFHRITLEDRNLPAIAERRVLRPQGEAARRELDAAFEQTAQVREAVWNTLLTSEGDRAMFRQVYPFSPALVQTLIAVSGVLQRERTALKVMMQLLVDHRDTLQLGDVVPVGDLFDVIAHGDEAFSQDTAIHFENARRLYHRKLLPLLEQQHNARREELEHLPYDDPRRAAFRGDDRLAKTLLLAALVPGVETLRALTAERLAALNHGSIKTPVPGREAQEALRRVRSWAAEIGEIRIGDEANPVISVQLTGVDTAPILAQAEREDNQGNRVRRVRQLLFEAIGVQGDELLDPHLDLTWKQTKRSCLVLFGNLRELGEGPLENDDERWKLVIDWPFDEANRGPRDDLAMLQRFLESHPQGTHTLCWVPAFLSAAARDDLGRLVVLEHVLAGERFEGYARDYSPPDRHAARSLLENQRSVLRQRVKSHLEAAYGLEALAPGSLDTDNPIEPQERFQSLDPRFQPGPPAGGTLREAVEGLLYAALACDYPAAPAFEAEVRLPNLARVYQVVSQAAQVEDGRVPVDRPLRPLLRQIANPLQLGEMGADATHFVLGRHWQNHFTRKQAETGLPLTVRNLRRWIDEPRRMGLPREVQNLVILTFAAQTDRAITRQGAAVEAALANLPDECELREQRLPEMAQWQAAVERAAAIFRLDASPLRNAANVARLSAEVHAKASAARPGCDAYCRALRERLAEWKIPHSEADRMRTAAAVLELVERIYLGKADDAPANLAAAEIATSAAAMGECLALVDALARTLHNTSWELFEAVQELPAPRDAEGAVVRARVEEALRSDEHAVPLVPVLLHQQSRAVRLLARIPGPEPPPVPGLRAVASGSKAELDLEEARALLARLEQEAGGRRLRLNVGWVIEEEEQG